MLKQSRNTQILNRYALVQPHIPKAYSLTKKREEDEEKRKKETMKFRKHVSKRG